MEGFDSQTLQELSLYFGAFAGPIVRYAVKIILDALPKSWRWKTVGDKVAKRKWVGYSVAYGVCLVWCLVQRVDVLAAQSANVEPSVPGYIFSGLALMAVAGIWNVVLTAGERQDGSAYPDSGRPTDEQTPDLAQEWER